MYNSLDPVTDIDRVTDLVSSSNYLPIFVHDYLSSLRLVKIGCVEGNEKRDTQPLNPTKFPKPTW